MALTSPLLALGPSVVPALKSQRNLRYARFLEAFTTSVRSHVYIVSTGNKGLARAQPRSIPRSLSRLAKALMGRRGSGQVCVILTYYRAGCGSDLWPNTSPLGWQCQCDTHPHGFHLSIKLQLESEAFWRTEIRTLNEL